MMKLQLATKISLRRHSEQSEESRGKNGETLFCRKFLGSDSWILRFTQDDGGETRMTKGKPE